MKLIQLVKKLKIKQEKLRLRDEIVKWQMKFYNSSEVSLDLYKNFLKKYEVERVALDYMEKREELFNPHPVSPKGREVAQI